MLIVRRKDMETLVVDQHRNQCYGRSKSRITDQFSSPSKGFKVINCRTFEASTGFLLPSPSTTFNCSPERKTPHEPPKLITPRSNPITISRRPDAKTPSFEEDDFSYSELWAGPAYSNSPPPSSLPIPKFSLRQKRSSSLDLPLPSSGVILRPLAKSAPPSPTRDTFSSATENLRRLLQLDVTDD